MTPVEPASVRAVEVLNGPGDLSARRLDDEVVMVRHQTPGVDVDAKPHRDSCEQGHECRPVFVIRDNDAAVVPARSDVVEAAGLEATGRSRHRAATLPPARTSR